MKVAIITEGNNKTGYGHLTRCLSIYQAFEEKGIIPYYIANCGDDKKTILPEVILCQLDWINKSKKLMNIINGFDIAIIDSYLAPLKTYEKIQYAVEKSVYIDDYIRLNYPPGIIVNGTIGAENLPYNKDNKHQYLLGINYMPLRKEFWDIDIPNRNQNEIKNILITFGGQDIRNLTSKVVNYLINEFPHFNYHVVVGNKNYINKNKSKNIDYYYTLNANEMLRVMLKCDIAISAAGQTTYELARTGLKTIAIGVADNQKYNLAGWIDKRFLKEEIWYNDERILIKINNQIKNINNRGNKIFYDGQGSRRIVKFVLN